MSDIEQWCKDHQHGRCEGCPVFIHCWTQERFDCDKYDDRITTEEP